MTAPAMTADGAALARAAHRMRQEHRLARLGVVVGATEGMAERDAATLAGRVAAMRFLGRADPADRGALAGMRFRARQAERAGKSKARSGD